MKNLQMLFKMAYFQQLIFFGFEPKLANRVAWLSFNFSYKLEQIFNLFTSSTFSFIFFSMLITECYTTKVNEDLEVKKITFSVK